MPAPSGIHVRIDKVYTSPFSKITIQGYKSIIDETSVELKNLTIFAGINSSGKSSMFQPLLLLKQTLDESSDSGEIRINGPHLDFTLMDQFLSKTEDGQSNSFSIEFEIDGKKRLKVIYNKEGKHFKITQIDYERNVTLCSNMTHDEYYQTNLHEKRKYKEDFALPYRESDEIDDTDSETQNQELKAVITRKRCFLDVDFFSDVYSVRTSNVADRIKEELLGIIHVSALRGNPKRFYRKTFVGSNFSGPFEPYVSSILKNWIELKDNRIKEVNQGLAKLNLTTKVKSTEIDDVTVNIEVNRYPVSDQINKEDLISIADVGFGISQTLPVIIALLQAQPGQIVYIEQPEIHLHPKAQFNLAELLINAANRGVYVIIETHSDSLLFGVQTLIAEEKIAPEKVILHWFSRDTFGKTIIRSSNMDTIGGYGDCPEDFSETMLVQRSRYLDAVQKLKFSQGMAPK
jgi:predicted ATPase